MNSIRITTGALRGRRVPVPPDGVRPTSERARQAFFNIVAPRIEGARFLDLFAGSGAFALEAASRGAASVLAVDASPWHVQRIETLAREWNAAVRAVAGDVFDILRTSGTYDLAYADPPYDFKRYDDLLAALDASAISGGGIVAIEHRRRTEPFTVERNHLRFMRRAEYGEVWITLFERPSPENDPAVEARSRRPTGERE